MRKAVKLFLAALLYICFAQATDVRAEPLQLVINNPVQNIPYDGSATFFGSLTNLTTGTIIIGTPGFTQPGQREPYSYELIRLPPFNGGGTLAYNHSGIPISLEGQSSTGNIQLFTLSLSPGGTFNGLFTVHYYLPNEPGILRTVYATVTLSASNVPEPATLLLLGTGVAGLIGIAQRRRQAHDKD